MLPARVAAGSSRLVAQRPEAIQKAAIQGRGGRGMAIDGSKFSASMPSPSCATEVVRCREAFTVFAVPFRYEADPVPMGMDRAHWFRRAEELVASGASLIDS